MLPNLDRILRRLVPSTARISYNPLIITLGDSLAKFIGLPFGEVRNLPPNHLRIRIGTGNRIFANHFHFLEMGYTTWLKFFSHHYCSSGSDIVELGCGCGRVALPLKGEWFTGTYTGVDVDQEMLDYCKNNFPEGRFRFLISPHASRTYSATGTNKQLNIAEPDSVDFIYSMSLYSHLLEREVDEYLRESFRILRPNGLMHLTFFCIDHVMLGQRWTFRHRHGKAYIENIRYPEAAVAYAKDDMINFVQATGFRDVSVASNPNAIGGTNQTELTARK